MIVEGKKKGIYGDFFLRRYLTSNGKSKLAATYRIKIEQEQIVVYDGDKDISDQVRRIEFLNKDSIIMWMQPSRLGLKYSIEKEE